MICPYCRTENAPGAIRCAACTSWMTERPPAREWTRAREGSWIGGVASGLAKRFGLPVVAVRLAFVLGTLLGFWGLVVYVALWVIMPQEPLMLPPPAQQAEASAHSGGPPAGP
jgi:phage shock protein PspC (stress-responsive transcriptional regulator)